MSIVGNIKNVLVEQINGYRMLLDLLQRERESLISLNADGVENLSKEKDTFVLKLRLLEEERIRLTNKYKADNMITGDISLQRFYEITGDEALRDMRLQLISLLQGIAELNEFNRILIKRSLHFVKSAAKFLDVLGLNADLKNTGAILSKEV